MRPCTTSRCELDNLPAFRPGNLRYLDDARGHVARRRVLPDLPLDALAQRIGQLDPVAQPDEKDDPFVVVPFLPDDQAFDHLVEPLDLAVDLRRSDPDSAGIERHIRPPVDDHAVR